MKEAIESIKKLFEKGVDAWNRGDVDGHLATYADLETVRLISSGKMMVGKKAISEALHARFHDDAAMGTLTIEMSVIELFSASDALVVGNFRLEREAAVSRGVFTCILKQFSDGWAIVLDHSSAFA